MNTKTISPTVGIAIGVVAIVIILALGYKFFIAPQPLPSVKDHPPRPGYTHYPGTQGAAGAAATPAAASH